MQGVLDALKSAPYVKSEDKEGLTNHIMLLYWNMA